LAGPRRASCTAPSAAHAWGPSTGQVCECVCACALCAVCCGAGGRG
jgi:hypothetical protein